jgi:conjugal transfer/entry exclusion protein
MRRMILLALVIVVLGTSQVHAQGIPVIDVTNLLQNTVQAVQSVLMVGNMILELTPLGEIVLGDDFSEDMSSLGDVVREAQGLSYDLTSLNAQVTLLFHLDGAPRSSGELRKRLAAIRRVIFDAHVYALRTQTLIKTVLSAIRHLTRLMDAVGDLTGNMQANQTLVQLDTKMNQTLATLQVQTAAYERAETVERLSELMTIESIQRINEAVMEDYPK